MNTNEAVETQKIWHPSPGEADDTMRIWLGSGDAQPTPRMITFNQVTALKRRISYPPIFIDGPTSLPGSHTGSNTRGRVFTQLLRDLWDASFARLRK